MTISFIRAISISVVACLLCTSCATPYVWKKTDPHALNRMPKNQATEDHIRRHELKYAPDRDNKYYLVEKTGGEKAIKYTMRTIGTPLAVAFDVALVCLLALGGAAAANPDMFNTPSYTPYSYTPSTLYSPNTLYTPPAYTAPAVVYTPPARTRLTTQPVRLGADDEYKYKSSSGLRYEYDLNKPLDALRYETDIGAQMRDQMKSPLDELKQERDSWRGQKGGGIKR